MMGTILWILFAVVVLAILLAAPGWRRFDRHGRQESETQRKRRNVLERRKRFG